MSKVVKGVFRAVSKVVKGVVNTVKKVAKSKIGKIIMAAALVYFGGAAIMGGMQGVSAGTGFLSGAGTGISNAWTSLLQAGSSALKGSFTEAGKALSAGFQGSTMPAASSSLQTVGSLGLKAPVGSESLLGVGGESTAIGLKPSVGSVVNNPLTNTLPLPKPDPSFWSTNAAAAGVLVGGNIVGGAIQGSGAQKEAERQEQLKAAAEERYRRNVGAPLWGDQEYAGYTGNSAGNPLIAPRTDYQVAGGPALLNRGLVGSSMNPTFGYAAFPVFNPRTNYS